MSEDQGQVLKNSLPRRTAICRVKLTDNDIHIASKLNNKAESFKFYPLALDESNNIKDTAQILIFIRGINNSFEITEES